MPSALFRTWLSRHERGIEPAVALHFRLPVLDDKDICQWLLSYRSADEITDWFMADAPEASGTFWSVQARAANGSRPRVLARL